MAGRPTVRTPEKRAKLVQALALGSTRRLACLYGGLSEDAFAVWMKADTDFADAIKEAEGRAAIGWLAKIEQAATNGEWTAAAWKLERRYPHEYGKRVTEMLGKDGGDITVRVIYDNDVINPFASASRVPDASDPRSGTL